MPDITEKFAYQDIAVEEVERRWTSARERPVIVTPTGGGKSYTVAKIAAVLHGHGRRTLVICPNNELTRQDAQACASSAGYLDVRIFHAGRRSGQGEVTYATINYAWRHMDELEDYGALIIDEAHKVNNLPRGMYRELATRLMERNPEIRICGLTATPERTGQGDITQGMNTLFNGRPVKAGTIDELQALGVLCPSRAASVRTQIDEKGIGISRGDFILSELARRIERSETVAKAVDEAVAKADGRKHIIVFCGSIGNAVRVRDMLRAKGEAADEIDGTLGPATRRKILDSFESGRTRWLVNVDLLTTGYDYHGIDCGVLLRPTLSATLYTQMLGRTLRADPGKKDALWLDFTASTGRFGKTCGAFGKDGPAPEPVLVRRDDDLKERMREAQAAAEEEFLKATRGPDSVRSWEWELCRAGGDIAIAYFCKGPDGNRNAYEAFTLWKKGYDPRLGTKMRRLSTILWCAGSDIRARDIRDNPKRIGAIIRQLSLLPPPQCATTDRKEPGKAGRVLSLTWNAAVPIGKRHAIKEADFTPTLPHREGRFHEEDEYGR